MSGAVVWVVVGLGLLVVTVRRRSVAVGIVTAQALVLFGVALHQAVSGSDVAAALALAARGVGLAALFLWLVARSRESRRVRAGVAPLARAGLAVAFALLLTWLVPRIGLESRTVERGVLALVAFGLVVGVTRRATLFQILAIVLVENGLALAALSLPRASSLAIELGIVFDLTLVVLVAAVFHERIFAEFGSGDSASLRSLRD
jgi:hydrogenase-4 membrane subunit HyfE